MQFIKIDDKLGKMNVLIAPNCMQVKQEAIEKRYLEHSNAYKNKTKVN